MATIGQIADAIREYDNLHGFDNIMQPVVTEIDPADMKSVHADTVFVTSRLSLAAWPSARVVLDLEDGEALTDVLAALTAGKLEDLLRVWNVGAI